MLRPRAGTDLFRHQMRAVPLAARSLLDLPIALFEMLDDRTGDLVLLVLGQRSAHATDQAEAFAEPHHHAQSQFISLAPHHWN
jgi:hypothetical protein